MLSPIIAFIHVFSVRPSGQYYHQCCFELSPESPINDQKLHTRDFYCGRRSPKPHEWLKANIPPSCFYALHTFHLIEIYMLILSESAWGQNLQIGLKVQEQQMDEWIHAMHSECCSSENCNKLLLAIYVAMPLKMYEYCMQCSSYTTQHK